MTASGRRGDAAQRKGAQNGAVGCDRTLLVHLPDDQRSTGSVGDSFNKITCVGTPLFSRHVSSTPSETKALERA